MPFNSFSDFYKPNQNWMDLDGVDVKTTLTSKYPGYYDENHEVNMPELLNGIIGQEKKAKELFKSLFKMPYKGSFTSRLTSLPPLQSIIDKYGSEILAHGVEEMKGGQYNLLMMAVTGDIKINQAGWGKFQPGLPNISPVQHGPYYIIYSIGNSSVSPSYPKIGDIEHILVPFKENIEILIAHITKMETEGLVTSLQKDIFIDKLISYDQLEEKLAEEFPIEENQTENATVSTQKPDLSKSHSPLLPSHLDDKKPSNKRRNPGFFERKTKRHLDFSEFQDCSPASGK
ncbi:hypothetical protein [Legionella spiritensis]|uniref:hypothetical protein n=1 Tax=Legionella spiritensis TaxID=452 RepID=UPI000F6F4134|nr:hypothetical protein [Legionella spiritensis]VEG92265.1 Uncharacterised protein [Legionella spiritensis]